MSTAWVLIAVCITYSSIFGSKTVNVDVVIFTQLERCYANIPTIKDQLKQCNEIYVECQKREIK